MSAHEFSVDVRPLEAWSDAALRSAYELLVFSVLHGHATNDANSATSAGLDAEMMGMELVRRGLL